MMQKMHWQNTTPFHDKNSKQSWNITKLPKYKKKFRIIKNTVNVIFHGRQPKAFLIRSGIRQGYLLWHCLFSIALGVLVNAAGQEKSKRHLTRKEEIKLSVFADDMILYAEIHKESTEKLLQLINKFSKVAVYKVNTCKNQLHYYTLAINNK